jgi:uncharacterized protein
MRILSWVLRSFRPLKMDELREALVVEDVEADVTFKELLEDQLSSSDIIECCKSLVIHEESSGLVRFTHFTAHQFIAEHVWTRLPPATHLANSCLTYFTSPDIKSTWLAEKFQTKRTSFYKYAIQNWALHTAGDAEDLPSIQTKFLIAFGQARSSQHYDFLYCKWASIPSHPERHVLLHIMARFGLAKLCELYLNGGLNSMFVPLSPIELTKRIQTLPQADGCLYEGSMLVTKDSEGTTPLCLAAHHGHEKIVAILLAVGAESSRSDDRYDHSALHLAADHSGVVEQLLAAGADVNAYIGLAETSFTNDDSICVAKFIFRFLRGTTPLHIAASSGYHTTVGVLLSAGAEVSAKDDFGATPLHHALLGRNYYSWQYVESIGLASASKVPLNVGAVSTVAEKLLQAGADVNQPDKVGQTVLHLAAISGQPRLVQQILTAGADVTKVNCEGRTSLFAAAGPNGDVAGSIIPILLAVGSDAAGQDWQGETALHVASEYGQHEKVERLLAAGANLDVRSHYHDNVDRGSGTYGGYTALHLATAGNHDAAVRALCSAGACLSVLTSSGETALSLAAALGNESVVEILLAAGATQTNRGLTATLINDELDSRRQARKLRLKYSWGFGI